MKGIESCIPVPAGELMCHSDIGTTLNGYTDSYCNDMRNAHEKVVREFVVR